MIKQVYETYTPKLVAKSTSGGNIVPTKKANNGIISDITRIEASCEIKSSVTNANAGGKAMFTNIKLGKNEVIKFRAPNLTTTQTFPAYVYYRYEKNSPSVASRTGSGGNGEARYATIMSLTSFISDQVGVSTFFTELFSRAGSAIKTFTAEKPGSSDVVIDQSNQLPNIFSTAIIVKANTEINGTRYYYKEADLRNNLTIFFEDESNSDKTVTFTYYPLHTGTMSIWEQCVKDLASSVGITLADSPTTFWRLSSTSSFPKGKLVIETGQRLYAQSGDYLLNSQVGNATFICTDLGTDPEYSTIPENSDVKLGSGDKLYIHYTPSSTNEDGETVNAEPVSLVFTGGDAEDPVILKPSGFTLIPTGDVFLQGTSPKKSVTFPGESEEKGLLSLAPNEQIEMRRISRVVLDKPARFYRNFESSVLDGSTSAVNSYELKDGEYIFYTDKNTQEAAYYGSGSVITIDQGLYIPKATDSVEIADILEQGMHLVPWSNYVQLSTNKKITITEYQYVTLTEGDTLNTLTVDSTDSPCTISNTQWTGCLSTEEAPITYTPAGSDTPTILPKIDLGSGLTPSAGWEVCSLLELSTSPGLSQTLRHVTVEANAKDPTSVANPASVVNEIANKVKVYTPDGVIEIAPSPSVSDSSLEPYIENGNWWIGSTDTGKTAGGEGAPVPYYDETGTWWLGAEKLNIVIGMPYEPISIKLDVVAQVASGNFEKDANAESSTATSNNTNLQMKVFKEEAPQLVELESLEDTFTPIASVSKRSTDVDASAVIARLNEQWTQVDVQTSLWSVPDQAGAESKPRAVQLNCMIPSDSDLFGIFCIYLNTENAQLEGKASGVFIEIPSEYGPAEDVVSIFNYTKTEGAYNFSWWDNGVDGNKLYLRAGLNCIKVAKSCSILIKAKSTAVGSVLYDKLRIVKGKNTHGLNLALLDPGAQYSENPDLSNKRAMVRTVLNNIKILDKNYEFYYNVPIENSLAIEFDDNISSFSNPYTLYDINNVNNSFVISKLDINYLDTGLKIAKSSRY